MKAVVAVHGRFHGFDLARELDQRSSLSRLITTYPRFAVHGLGNDTPLATAPWLEALRRGAPWLPFLPAPDFTIARKFARFASRHLPPDADLLIGWSSATLEAIPAARSRGMRVIIERGSSHIAHQARVLASAYAELGIRQAAVDPRMIEREIEEYTLADAIAVPTQFAAATFIAEGIPREKLIINPYGTDLEKFKNTASMRKPSDRLRILFVGLVGARKGVPWLLRAMEHLSPNVELTLVGPVEGSMRPLLAGAEGRRLNIRGPLRSPDLERAYADADVFCLPSLEEGLPLALLQALAAGLPVVATPETGAGDIVTDGHEGFLVPCRNPEALAHALDHLASPSLRTTMSQAARRRVAKGLGWQDYGERAVAAARRILAASP